MHRFVLLHYVRRFEILWYTIIANKVSAPAIPPATIISNAIDPQYPSAASVDLPRNLPMGNATKVATMMEISSIVWLNGIVLVSFDIKSRNSKSS